MINKTEKATLYPPVCVDPILPSMQKKDLNITGVSGSTGVGPINLPIIAPYTPSVLAVIVKDSGNSFIPDKYNKMMEDASAVNSSEDKKRPAAYGAMIILSHESASGGYINGFGRMIKTNGTIEGHTTNYQQYKDDISLVYQESNSVGSYDNENYVVGVSLKSKQGDSMLTYALEYNALVWSQVDYSSSDCIPNEPNVTDGTIRNFENHLVINKSITEDVHAIAIGTVSSKGKYDVAGIIQAPHFGQSPITMSIAASKNKGFGFSTDLEYANLSVRSKGWDIKKIEASMSITVGAKI